MEKGKFQGIIHVSQKCALVIQKFLKIIFCNKYKLNYIETQHQVTSSDITVIEYISKRSIIHKVRRAAQNIKNIAFESQIYWLFSFLSNIMNEKLTTHVEITFVKIATTFVHSTTIRKWRKNIFTFNIFKENLFTFKWRMKLN